MVLDPTFSLGERNVCFSRVLINGGSTINILYRDTAKKLDIKESQLSPSQTVFHCIVPGHSYSPISRIRLDVVRYPRALPHREHQVQGGGLGQPPPGTASSDQVHGGAPLWVLEDEDA
jgi:hypothetical protein